MGQLWQRDGGDMHSPSSTRATVIDMGAANFIDAREHGQPRGADQLCVGGSGAAAVESSSMRLWYVMARSAPASVRCI
jgi:hypothetical protein